MLPGCYTYSTSKAFRGIPHVINPALMRNRCRSFSLFVSFWNLYFSACLLVVAIPVSNPCYFAIRRIILVFGLTRVYSQRERCLWQQKAPLRTHTTCPYCRQSFLLDRINRCNSAVQRVSKPMLDIQISTNSSGVVTGRGVQSENSRQAGQGAGIAEYDERRFSSRFKSTGVWGVQETYLF